MSGPFFQWEGLNRRGENKINGGGTKYRFVGTSLFGTVFFLSEKHLEKRTLENLNNKKNLNYMSNIIFYTHYSYRAHSLHINSSQNLNKNLMVGNIFLITLITGTLGHIS